MGSEDDESDDGGIKEALEKAGMVSTGDERDQRSFAGAGAAACGDGVAARARLGIGVATLGTFVFPSVDAGAGVLPGAGIVLWQVPVEPLLAWCEESADGRVSTGCVGLVNVPSEFARGIGGRRTRNAKTGLDPAAGVFFARFLPEGVLVAIFPDCADEFEGKAGAGVAM